MSCGCIYVESGEVYETISNVRIPASQPRKCDECRKTIEKGELYECFLGQLSDDKKPETWTTCTDCLSVRDEFFCEGWAFGNIWEDVSYHVDEVGGEIDSDCLAALTPKARADVIDIIDEVWAEMAEDEEE